MVRINKRKQRKCTICGTEKSKLEICKKNGVYYEHWRKVNGQVSCDRCYQRLVDAPKRNPIRNPLNWPKLLLYKNKQYLMKERPRKGQCEKCGKKVGDEYLNHRKKLKIIRRTSLHHIKYHDNDFLKDTIELCNSCHSKESWRLGQITVEMAHKKKSEADDVWKV